MPIKKHQHLVLYLGSFREGWLVQGDCALCAPKFTFNDTCQMHAGCQECKFCAENTFDFDEVQSKARVKKQWADPDPLIKVRCSSPFLL